MICFYYPFDPAVWYDGDFSEAGNLIIPAGMGLVLRESSGVNGCGVWTVNKPY